MPAEDLQAFDSPRKLDTSNAQQMGLMWRHLRYAMGAVNFWLLHVVLPKETGQYTHRLTATPWFLADNVRGRLAGFSGTRDNAKLLPLQVRRACAHAGAWPAPQMQVHATNCCDVHASHVHALLWLQVRQVELPDQPRIAGTDGKMLHLLLQASYSTLQRRNDHQVRAAACPGLLLAACGVACLHLRMGPHACIVHCARRPARRPCGSCCWMRRCNASSLACMRQAWMPCWTAARCWPA